MTEHNVTFLIALFNYYAHTTNTYTHLTNTNTHSTNTNTHSTNTNTHSTNTYTHSITQHLYTHNQHLCTDNNPPLQASSILWPVFCNKQLQSVFARPALQLHLPVFSGKVIMSVSAMASQSCGFCGRFAATSRARAMSCWVSGHLNGAMILWKIVKSRRHTTQLYANMSNYNKLFF